MALNRQRAALLPLTFGATAATANAVHGQDHGFGTNDALIAASVIALLVIFAIGWRRMPRRRSGNRPVPWWRAALFVAGMLLLGAVLLPPFDDLADNQFSAHMLQHLVLLVVAPPMLVSSQAHVVLLYAWPLRVRRTVGRAISGTPGLRLVGHHSSMIWFVCLTSAAVLWFWHLPAIYDWARTNEAVHDSEHLLFLATELAFWRVILFRRERELSRAGAALIIVAMSVQGGLLAALITLAGHPMYLSYGTGSAALADQALGGVMMWVIGGTVYLVAFVILFGRALAAPGRSPRRRSKVGGAQLRAAS
jgi:cytochrome c oxidase assembly factor CtaG